MVSIVRLVKVAETEALESNNQGWLEPEEFQARLNRLGNTNIDRINRLFQREKFVYVHPRTQERIYGHHESTREELRQIKRTKGGGFVGQPCVPYAREENRCVSALMMGYDGEKLLTDVVTVGKKPQTFQTVWYSRHDRRK